MAKQYTIFAVKNAGDNFAISLKVERSKATIEAVGEGSFVATDGLKMFIVGDAESLSSVKPSDTGFGSTCGATPAKVQELAEILTSMDYSVDVAIAYAVIDKKCIYPIKEAKVAPLDEADENDEYNETCYDFTVPADKDDMIKEALELAASIGDVEGHSNDFVAICQFYLDNKKS